MTFHNPVMNDAYAVCRRDVVTMAAQPRPQREAALFRPHLFDGGVNFSLIHLDVCCLTHVLVGLTQAIADTRSMGYLISFPMVTTLLSASALKAGASLDEATKRRAEGLVVVGGEHGFPAQVETWLATRRDDNSLVFDDEVRATPTSPFVDLFSRVFEGVTIQLN